MASLTQIVGDWSDALPGVELEVQHGTARGSVYSLDGVAFLIGTVPGCDLRVMVDAKGKADAAVLCLIARHPLGASFRRLALTKNILVNGQSVAQCDLSDGDRIQIGLVEIQVAISPARTPSASATSESNDGFEESVRHMREKVESLAHDKPAPRDAVRSQYEAWEARPTSRGNTAHDDEEITRSRQENADLRRQIAQFHEQRDKLALLQKEIDTSKHDLAERLRKMQLLELDAVELRQRDRQREDDLARRIADVALREQRLEEERRHFEATQQSHFDEQANRQDDLKARHAELTEISRRAAKLFTAFGLALSGDGAPGLASVQQELTQAASAAAAVTKDPVPER